MTPPLTPEQQELQSSFRGCLSEHCTIAYVRSVFNAELPSDSSLWTKLFELGVLEFFATSPSAGGGGIRELGLFSAEAGYALLPDNLVDTALLVYFLTQKVRGHDAQLIASVLGESWLAVLTAGKLRSAVSESSPGLISVTASPKDSPAIYSISGVAHQVCAPTSLELLLLVDSHADSIYLCSLQGARRTSATFNNINSLDKSQPRSKIEFSATEVLKLSSLSAREFVHCRDALRCAELAGAARHSLDMTVEYLKTRKQFGVPVGGFQAVQHAAADMLVGVEALSALADFACWSADASPEQLPLASLSAALYGSEEALKVIEKAIQLHGGIGFTWEHDLHLFLRRAKVVTTLVAPGDAEKNELLGLATGM